MPYGETKHMQYLEIKHPNATLITVVEASLANVLLVKMSIVILAQPRELFPYWKYSIDKRIKDQSVNHHQISIHPFHQYLMSSFSSFPRAGEQACWSEQKNRKGRADHSDVSASQHGFSLHCFNLKSGSWTIKWEHTSKSVLFVKETDGVLILILCDLCLII